MRRRVVFSPQATETLERFYVEVAGQGAPETALRFIQDIETRCRVFGEFPMLGLARDDLLDGLRVLTFDRRVTVAYRIMPTHVLIVQFFWRGQDFEAALKGEREAGD